jgi:hypothetical protein
LVSYGTLAIGTPISLPRREDAKNDLIAGLTTRRTR